METFARADTQALVDDDNKHRPSTSLGSQENGPNSRRNSQTGDEAMLEAVLDNRRFANADEVRKYVSVIRGEPGNTPNPASSYLMAPGPLQKIIERRIAKLEDEPKTS